MLRRAGGEVRAPSREGPCGRGTELLRREVRTSAMSGAEKRPMNTETFREVLEEQRCALSQQVQTTIRNVRADGGKDCNIRGVNDVTQADVSDDDTQVALVQMRSEMLSKVEAAIRRLEQGRYGRCAECDESIAPERLRALPFAARCLPCEVGREATRISSGGLHRDGPSPLAGVDTDEGESGGSI